MIRISLICLSITWMVILSGCDGRQVRPPVLILGSDQGFGTYTTEILKAEGLNEFELDSLSDSRVTSGYLKEFSVVILTETPVDDAARMKLTEFVSSGGNLIAFCPDPELAGLFGLVADGQYIKEGYIALDEKGDYGGLIKGKKIRFHGTADKYILNGGKEIAKMFEDRVSEEGYPAIVSNSYNKGKAIAFLYNLPRNVVFFRQGNPRFAGIEKDGIPGLRGMDMFTDGWIDTCNSTINQADEHMALLTLAIEKMSLPQKPLPRLWYFPDTLKCLVTLTNDGEYKGEADFEPQFRDVDSMGARMSLYILETGKVSAAWAQRWSARGFEISGHPDDTREAENPLWKDMDSVLASKHKEISDKFGIQMRTNVNHWFVWCGIDSSGQQDFAAEARLEEKHGIGMDINYAHYDIKSNQGDQYLGPRGTRQGNFTGSGLPMKFADTRGRIINVYQHLNSVYDQEYTESHDPEGFFNAFRGLMDRSLQDGVYSYISVKSHNDEYYFSKVPLMRMIAYARSRSIPVWTALDLLDFLKMKDEAGFTEIRWSDNRLTFNLNSSVSNNNGLTFMVPEAVDKRKIGAITLNGRKMAYTISSVRGTSYALATVKPGENYSVAVKYIE